MAAGDDKEPWGSSVGHNINAESERPSNSVCDCSCQCHDTGIGKAGITTRILGSAHNSIDLYVSTPPKTKWIFKEEMKNERTRAD